LVTELSRDIPELLFKANRSLSAARLLLDHEYFPEAVSRAYYAMFYAATALLHSEGIAVTKHSAVIAQMGRHFAKTGKIDPKLHRALIDVFDERQTADYGGILFSREATEASYTAASDYLK
jgi:uncharacterized protein (UPF0332 family)